jgi:hypothetical protein
VSPMRRLAARQNVATGPAQQPRSPPGLMHLGLGMLDGYRFKIFAVKNLPSGLKGNPRTGLQAVGMAAPRNLTPSTSTNTSLPSPTTLMSLSSSSPLSICALPSMRDQRGHSAKGRWLTKKKRTHSAPAKRAKEMAASTNNSNPMAPWRNVLRLRAHSLIQINRPKKRAAPQPSRGN